MAVVVLEVVTTAAIAVVWAEAVELGCRYFPLDNLTTCTQTACCDSVYHPLSKYLGNFNVIPLGIVVIVVTAVALISLVIVLNRGSTSSSSSINMLPLGQ